MTLFIYTYYYVLNYKSFLFKVYFKNVHPKFPDGGKMSQHLNNLKINDTIDVRGPSGRLQYAGNGTFLIKKMRKDPPIKMLAKKLNMIAGIYIMFSRFAVTDKKTYRILTSLTLISLNRMTLNSFIFIHIKSSFT